MAANAKHRLGAQAGRLPGAQADRRSAEHRSPDLPPAEHRSPDPPPGEHRSRGLPPRRSRIEVRRAAASPAEAAAIAAAIEQFLRDTAPAPAPAGPAVRPWLRAGLYEHAGLDPSGPSPWGDGEPWGR